MTNEYSVLQFSRYSANSFEYVEKSVNLKTAVSTALRLESSVGGRYGSIQKITITDGEGKVTWEWQHSRGLVYPPSSKGADSK
jgi:hypothetical protein